VLAQVSFDVAQGTSMAIVGPNGAGKTVLFRALIGAVPHEGTVRWADGTRIGYVPQKLDVERDLPITGEEFLHAKAAQAGASRDDIERAMATVGFTTGNARRTLGTLSGGQFQRLLVAAALLGSPTVLLLDEPTAGVDEPGQEAMNETIERLRRERLLSILLISHDLTVVYRYADHVLCLGHGQPCFGAPRSVLTPAMLEELYGAPVQYHVHDAHRG
jgi:zinc transport system ATP-binding protein